MLFAVTAAWLLLAAGSAPAQSVQSKQAQAQAVLAEIQQLDSDVARAAEAYNYARIQLDEIEADLASNGRHLVAARKSLVVAQQRIAQRLRDLYVYGNGDSTLEVILGARSLDEIITRLTAIDRVSSQDATLLEEVKRYRAEVEARRAKLRRTRADQARLVAEREAEKRSIEARLAERQRMLESVKGEIARLQAEERRRQAALAARARALAAERLAAQQAVVSAADTTFSGGATAYIPVAPPPDGSKASQVISIAMQYLGVPYVWGGSSPATGFDCSGFTSYVFAQIGISLPHHAASQYGYGVPVSRDDLQPADLVFFNGLGHMGMYIGNGLFIHAPHTGDVVKISSIHDSWYAGTWVGARRIL